MGDKLKMNCDRGVPARRFWIMWYDPFLNVVCPSGWHVEEETAGCSTFTSWTYLIFRAFICHSSALISHFKHWAVISLLFIYFFASPLICFIWWAQLFHRWNYCTFPCWDYYYESFVGSGFIYAISSQLLFGEPETPASTFGTALSKQKHCPKLSARFSFLDATINKDTNGPDVWEIKKM